MTGPEEGEGEEIRELRARNRHLESTVHDLEKTLGGAIRPGEVTDTARPAGGPEAAEKASVEAERQRLYAVLDTLPVYVVLLSEDYHVPFANRFFRERFGESHGKRCYEYLFRRNEPCENCETYKVMKTRAPHQWEWLGPDNRNYEIHDYPFTDSDGSRLIMEVGIDVTGQKKAHEELKQHHDNLEALVSERTKDLQESESRLRILYESMTEGFANHEIVYRDGKAVDYIITGVNPAFEQITGIPRSEAVGRRASELYGTGNPPYLELYARVASGAGPEHFETYFPPMKQHFSVSAFSPGKGKFATVFTDITERKRAEESLREAELRYRTVAENTYDWEFWLDPGGKFVYCSPACERITGHRAGEFHTDSGLRKRLIHPDDVTVFERHLREVEEVQKGGTGEWRFLRPDGSWCWIEHVCQPVYGDRGEFLGTRGSNRDITDRKKAGEALRESEEKYRIIVETANEGIWITDADRRTVFVNQRMADMLGYPAEEILGRTPSAFLDPGQERLRQETAATLKTGIRTQKEFLFRRKDGSDLWVISSASPVFDGEGHFQRTISMLVDITDRKRSEERIVHLASFPELNPNPVFELDSAGEVIYANTAAMNTLEDLGLGNNPGLFLPGDIQVMLPRVMEGDVNEEVRVGERIYLETVTLNPLTRTMRIYARDITEMKRAEVALRDTSQHLENLINYANAPIIVWDPEFRITRFNHAFERLTGRSAEEVVGENLGILFPPETATGSMDHIRRVMAGERWEVEEIPIAHRDGNVRTVLWNSATLYEADGKTVSSAIAQGQDITDRKEAEQELAGKAAELAGLNAELSAEIAHRKKAEEEVRKTLSVLNAALESTADAMLVVDRSGRITSYNQNFTTMWNIPESVLHTLDPRIAVDHLAVQMRDRDGFLDRMKEISDHPPRESYDMLELMDGRIIERYSKPQRIGNAIVGRVYSFRDITDRKRAELRLIQSLEEKEVLLREIHHRVKNNLQLTTSLLDMTRMRTPDPGTGSILTDVMMKIQTMAQIHTRLYESKRFDRINMDGQVRDQIRAIGSIYGGGDREITTEIESPALFLPLDQAIPCALALNEILSNAYKHAFAGQKSGTVKYRAEEAEGRIRFTVTDDGIGIPPGFDLNKANTLGLKLVRTLVEKQLRGTLRMKRRKKGTEVIVEIPVKREE